MTGKTTDYEYIGDELELFKHATNWKQYMLAVLKPYIKGKVLEVGAGIAGTTQLFCTESVATWTALEPDASLAETFTLNLADKKMPAPVKLLTGTLADLEPGARFDCVLYIDVLEHIEQDRDELRLAAETLAAGGRLIVLSPAHQFLYSPFDKAIGHFRRYSAEQLLALTPPGVKIELIRYLDAVGMLASMANRLMLKQSMPQPRQLWLWDKALVPISRLLDPVFAYKIGKSVVAVWTKL